LWQIIKRALVAEDGREYFESSFKGAMVPGGADGVLMFKATLVWAEAADKPTKLVCGILDATTPEVTLQVKGSDGKPTALRRNVQPGSDVWFQGVVLDYSKDPFMVTFDVRLEDVRFESPGTMQKKRAIPLPKP
jgi:hypothetical protein